MLVGKELRVIIITFNVLLDNQLLDNWLIYITDTTLELFYSLSVNVSGKLHTSVSPLIANTCCFARELPNLWEELAR